MNIRTSVLVLILTALIGGCGASYGSIEQYKTGDWYGLAGPGTAAKTVQDKRVDAKLDATPALIGYRLNKDNQLVPIGYLGYVANFDRVKNLITIKGPETREYLLLPGQEVVDYLIPGEYTKTIKEKGKLPLVIEFEVTDEIRYFGNRPCHWFAYAD